MSSNGYEYLEPRTGGVYRQLFIKGRSLMAEQIYRETIGEEARTPAEVARDFGIPLGAVEEAIDYSVKNQSLLQAERAEDAIRIAEFEKKYPPLLPPADMQPRS